jgi:hypothetical protein
MGSESAPAEASTLLPDWLRKPGVQVDTRLCAMATRSGRALIRSAGGQQRLVREDGAVGLPRTRANGQGRRNAAATQ